MRFLVDECTGPSVARWLREQGHDVFSVYEQARGLDDASVMELAARENRIIITSDKEFGTRVVRDRQVSAGILLLRLRDERIVNKVRVLAEVLRDYGDQLVGNLVVVSEGRVRIVSLRATGEGTEQT
jgi:predicted nuclease of predicted toxin-antitoxin system